MKLSHRLRDTMHLPDPKFPPLIKGHAVKAPLRAHDEACRRASAGQLGAGDLVWSRNTARAECALILEPDVPLSTCGQMAALAFVALAEALGHLGPPQMPVEVRWPGDVLVDSASCGAIGLTAPLCPTDAVPPWLVVSVDLTLTFANDKREPGERLSETALDLQGCGDVTRTMVIETLATCLQAWLHTWQEDGFRPIHDQWIYRAVGRDVDADVDGVRGRVIGLDEEGGLLLQSGGGRVVTRALIPHIRRWP